MTPNEINELKGLLHNDPKKIVIVPHRNPDGDAVGSTCGLYLYLKKYDHEVVVITPNAYPDFLDWIPGAHDMLVYEQDTATCDQLLQHAELVFNLDHNAFHRAGEMEHMLNSISPIFIMIDHHQQPDDFATYMYSDTSMSSTCQMVYHFIEFMNDQSFIDDQIAAALYTGIITDTGNFKYRSTTATTLRVAAALVDKGADSEQINRNIYDVNSPSRMKLLGVALNNLVILEEYKTAFITLSQKELDDNGFKKGDTEGFVNYGLSLKGIVFALIFIENKADAITKISLRSKGDFDVNLVAREHFNGGGHKNAAGGRTTVSIEETKAKLISILPDYEEALNNTVV